MRSIEEIRAALELVAGHRVDRAYVDVREAIDELAELRELTRCVFHAVTHKGPPLAHGMPSTYERCTLRAGHPGECKP